MELRITQLHTRPPEVIAELTEVWESSVRATHLFLSEQEIERLRGYVPQALSAVDQLAAVRDGDGRWVGFMGTEEGRLEMLFLAPQARGRGVGRRLLQYGIDRFNVRTLTVNEQNPGAVGFYQHMGFRVVRRTPLDEQGAPYPLLYMERRGPDAAPRFEQDNLYAEE